MLRFFRLLGGRDGRSRYRTWLNSWTGFRRRGHNCGCFRGGRLRPCQSRTLHPAEIVECVGKNNVQRGRINLFRRRDPVDCLVRIVVLKLPCGLRVVECGSVTSELELFHHLLRTTLLAFEQKRHENLEFDQL